MRRYLIWTILSLPTALFAQTPATDCCELKVSSGQNSRTELTATVTNIGQPTISLTITGPTRDFGVRVTAADTGQEPKRTEYGKRLLTEPWSGGSMGHKELATGESISQTLDLSKIFEFGPGTYDVSLTRNVRLDGKSIQLEVGTQIRIP